MTFRTIFLLLVLPSSTLCFGFESTKVLPEGVRSLNFRFINTTTSEKTDGSGERLSLAEALWKPLKYRNVLSGEEGMKKLQLEAFLIANEIDYESSLGEFRADLNAEISAYVPIIAWGINKQLTIAIGAPYYDASTDIQVGFKPNSGAEQFISLLSEPSTNNIQGATETVEKLNKAVSRLNERLIKNSYSPLQYWRDKGWGDLTVGMKYLSNTSDMFPIAYQVGMTLPTGRPDDSNILTDLPFGDGQWDTYAGLISDQLLTDSLFTNQYIKYTHQFRGDKILRWKTYEETIEAENTLTNYKLGDKIDSGISLQFDEKLTGMTGGIGAVYYRKFSDSYDVDIPEVKAELERSTDQTATYGEIKIGYSTVSAFQKKKFFAPAMINLEFRKQYFSRNMPTTDFTQLEMNLFF